MTLTCTRTRHGYHEAPQHYNTTLFLVTALILHFPSFSYAADFSGSLKSVTITDSAGANQPPAAVIHYTQNGKTLTFDASSSLDPDGNIVNYTWNFGDNSSGSGPTVVHTFMNDGSYQVTLSVIDDKGAVALSKVDIAKTPGFSKNINFQPADSNLVDGYSPDFGFAYDNTRGYGWNTYMPNSRDRNNVSSPDKTYDTNIIYISESNLWEIALPNGQYNVSICSGDPSSPTGTQVIQAEGVEVINGILSNTNKWIEGTKTVTVADGKLTITFHGSSGGMICWIKIESK